MKKPFFSNADRAALLNKSAQGWAGTPFHPHAQVRGAGVDCVHLAAALYRETGFMPVFQPGNYNLDGGSHENKSRIREYLIETGKFMEVLIRKNENLIVRDFMAGDLLTLRLGRVEWHVGVMLEHGLFQHVFAGYNVMATPLADPTWSKSLLGVWRPME